MEREAVSVSNDLLEGKTIGNRPAYEWVESKLSSLRRKYKLGKFKADLYDFEVKETIHSERVVSFTGLEETGNEEVGFIAGFVEGELKMLSVFANLEDRFARFIRTGYNEQFNEWVLARKELDVIADDPETPA